MTRISAVVICGNEEANIADCLESVKWCDEIGRASCRERVCSTV